MPITMNSFLATLADSLSATIVACCIPILAYYFVKSKMEDSEDRARDPPSASQWIPFLSHTRTFASGSRALAMTFMYARASRFYIHRC